MTTNTSVDVMVNGGRPQVVAAVLVDPSTGQAVAPSGGGGSGGGDASAANQVTGNATLAEIAAALAAALPLPTGAATAAAQDTGNTSLAAINTKLGTALPLPTGAATAANQATGNTSLAAIVTALAGLLGVVPQMAAGGHLAVTTAAGGTTFVAFASQACKQLTVINNTGTVLEVQRGGSGIAVPVFPATYFTFFGLTNANQLGVRRVDQAATSVTAQAVWEA
ncbi:hypothetical protein ACRC7T_04025 [Segnochrobactraceae bacterium EtOH-i3]